MTTVIDEIETDAEAYLEPVEASRARLKAKQQKLRQYKEKENADNEAAEQREGLSQWVFENRHVRELVEQTAKKLKVPVELVITAVLGTFSVACGKGLRVQYKQHDYTPLGLYFIGFSGSGDGKTATFSVITKPLAEKEAELDRYLKENSAGTKAQLKAVVARIRALEKMAEKGLDAKEGTELASLTKSQEELEKELMPVDLTVEDFTVEALGGVMASNREQISAISDEAGKCIINLLGEYSKKEEPQDALINKSYSGGDYKGHRITTGRRYIPNPWMSLMWLVQPDKAPVLLSNQWLRQGGFLARCMIAHFEIEPSGYNEESVDPQLLREFCNQWNRVYNAYRGEYADNETTYTVKWSIDARRKILAFDDHVTAVKKATHPNERAFISRWVENARRVAGVLHAIRYLDKAHKHELDGSTVEKAIEIVQWFCAQQQAILHEKAAEKLSERAYAFLEKVSKAGKDGITLRQFKRHNWAEQEVMYFAGVMPEKIEVAEHGGDKKGQPGKTFKLKVPLVYGSTPDKKK